MEKPSISWEDIKKEWMQDSEFVQAVKELEPEYELIRQIIKERIEQNLTQEDLARKANTRQSNISRLESGEYNPSLQFLKKIAKALGKNICISIK